MADEQHGHPGGGPPSKESRDKGTWPGVEEGGAPEETLHLAAPSSSGQQVSPVLRMQVGVSVACHRDGEGRRVASAWRPRLAARWWAVAATIVPSVNYVRSRNQETRVLD